MAFGFGFGLAFGLGLGLGLGQARVRSGWGHVHAEQLAPLGAFIARLEPRHVRVLRVGGARARDQPGEHDAPG